MSQADSKQPTDDSTQNQTDLSPVVSELAAMRDRLEALSESHVSDTDDLDVVELRQELKQLGDQIEETRKEVVEPELRERVDVGESLCGLKRVGSHSKFVADDPGTVIARAASLGIDYTQFVSLDASTLSKMDEDIADIGRSEYDYFL